MGGICHHCQAGPGHLLQQSTIINLLSSPRLCSPPIKDLFVGEMLGREVVTLFVLPGPLVVAALTFLCWLMVGLTVGGEVTWDFIISSFSCSRDIPERSVVLLLLVSVTSLSPRLERLSQFSPSLRSSF